MALRSIVIAAFCFCTLPAGAQQGPRHWFFPPEVVFKEHHSLSNYAAMCRRCSLNPEKGFSPGHQYNLEREKFGLYVPDINDANTPYGLLVWIQANGRVKMPETYRNVLAKYRLIYVAAGLGDLLGITVKVTNGIIIWLTVAIAAFRS